MTHNMVARFVFKAALIVITYALGGVWGVVALFAAGVAIGSYAAMHDNKRGAS